MNVININEPIITRNRIDYEYKIDGEWKKFFKEEHFYVEYNCNIESIPESIAIIPFICNILPIAWLCNAVVNLKECDKSFYESIPEVKKGFINMYPEFNFKGKINPEKLIDNTNIQNNGSIAFFSGGVDAFDTLLRHINEKPIICTVWGADVKIGNQKGWDNVEKNIKEVSNEYNLEYIILKSNLRECFDNVELANLIKPLLDSYWYYFQHAIGMIGLVAPIDYLKGIGKNYFSSSYTEKDKNGPIPFRCGSDITIESYLKICNAITIHDGYEFDRQGKVHNIVEYCRNNNKKVKLRVCWESVASGKNCCKCEKCQRTMLELYAEGVDPKNYGFNYTDVDLKNIKHCEGLYNEKNILRYYKPIQNAMKNNIKMEQLPNSLKWFYTLDLDKLENRHTINSIKRKITKISNKIKKKLEKRDKYEQ